MRRKPFVMCCHRSHFDLDFIISCHDKVEMYADDADNRTTVPNSAAVGSGLRSNPGSHQGAF